MPKTKFQNVVFTLMMSFLMVYAMISGPRNMASVLPLP